MLKVLWLCSWYPNKLSNFDGDFIQRHAQAASINNKIHVLKLTPDVNTNSIVYEKISCKKFPNLIEEFVYYPKLNTKVSKLRSYHKWFKEYLRRIREYIEMNGRPDLIHINIPLYSGLVAIYIKQRFNIPFVVTEHWGGYNTVDKNNYFNRDWISKFIIKQSFKKALRLHSVSEYLLNCIKEFVCDVNSSVIPNVVDCDYFYYAGSSLQENSRFQLLHVSNGAEVKNVEGIIGAFLKLDHTKYSLNIIGLSKEKTAIYKINYPQITFLNEIKYEDVARFMQRANVLILYSKIENSPCVICESLCCGTPVIATNVGGIPELINENNGILINGDDVNELINAITKMREKYHNYNRKTISEVSQSFFNYSVIGKKFDEFYRNALSI